MSNDNDDYSEDYDDDLAEVMTVGDWLITFLLLAIPIVNIIMIIYWAASGSVNPSKSNFAKAYLILIAIAFCLGILLAFLLPTFIPSRY